MNTAMGLAGLGAVAVVVFGVALLAGRAIGPVDAEPAPHDTHAGEATGGHAEHESRSAGTTTEIPGGLMTSRDGHTLTLTDSPAAADSAVPVSTVTASGAGAGAKHGRRNGESSEHAL
jgi:hypothetical protein